MSPPKDQAGCSKPWHWRVNAALGLAWKEAARSRLFALGWAEAAWRSPALPYTVCRSLGARRKMGFKVARLVGPMFAGAMLSLLGPATVPAAPFEQIQPL